MKLFLFTLLLFSMLEVKTYKAEFYQIALENQPYSKMHKSDAVIEERSDFYILKTQRQSYYYVIASVDVKEGYSTYDLIDYKTKEHVEVIHHYENLPYITFKYNTGVNVRYILK
jgi:hypothetical protein